MFGALDWPALIDAARRADMPLYVAYTAADKMIFFLWWGLMQAAAIRRFVTTVSRREVISLRGGAELLRSVNNPLADAAFFYGVSQLTRGSVTAVVAAAGLPFVCHFAVLLLQATIALLFLDGGPAGNRDVSAFVLGGWTTAVLLWLAVRVGLWQRWVGGTTIGLWLSAMNVRALFGFAGWLALLAVFDVLIQGLASRAFGVPIPWMALAARLPILYLVLSLPSFGNFGTRELAWAACFSDYAPRETLVAYALATNALFLVFHVAIGVAFLPKALELISQVRRLRREGVPQPLLHDASDP